MTTPDFRDESVARMFHEAYERLAPSFGYETRRASSVPWSDVPEPNRSLMIAVAGEVRLALAQQDAEAVREEYQRFYDFVGDAEPSVVDAWHFTENMRQRGQHG